MDSSFISDIVISVMENCLKRRDLESGSELDDTEDSELDNDLDVNLLTGERKDFLTASDRSQRQQFHAECDSGLISPYKRLRVEDLAHSSAESQAGEEEAHSLLRSIDGCDDLSWLKSREGRGQIPGSATSSPTKFSDSIADEAGSNSEMTPRRQLVKRGTSIDEGLRQLAMETEVREFPRPPAIDRGQGSPKAKRELDSLLLASYHPDFQTLESRHISYHSRSQDDLLTTASKLEVTRKNSGANTCDSFDLLEVHTGDEEDAGDAIYEEMLSDNGIIVQPSDPPSIPESYGAHSGHVEVNETQSRSVGISTWGIPVRASPLPAPGSLASTVASSSQRGTNSDSVSAVYDSVDSEPEGTSWPSSRLGSGSGSSSSSVLPKLTASSGAQTSTFQELSNGPSIGAHRQDRSSGMDEQPVGVMTSAPDPISYVQSMKSLSWDDICKQYQQHIQHQHAPDAPPVPGPQHYQQAPQQHHAPFPPAPASACVEDFTPQPQGQREMLSYLGYPAQYRRRGSSQRSLQSHSSQESGRQHRSTNSRSSQESIDHVEKSYPSSLVISENKSKKAVLQSPGHLKISAYWNVGLLTVHVIQARCLSSSWASHCDSYVKMSLVPDESRRTRCKTQVHLGSNNPVYDEKFSMEILEEDRKKRLLISVWHKDQSNGASEFLGCMSFGVQSLLQKDLDGWYYLLTEEVGRKKHLQAHTKPKTVLTARSHQNIPHINKAVEGLERIVITVQRGKNSFGFSFIDEFPPKVGRVDRASPAEQAGVKKGDMVIRINGQNVSRSTCEGVAHLIKKMNPQSITLELQREHVVKTTVEISTSGHNPHHPSPYNKRGVGTSTDHLYESITDRSDHTKENWVSASQDGEFLTDDESAYYPQNHQQQAAITSTPRPFIRPTHKTVSSASLQSTNKHEFIHRLMSLELDYIDFMHYGIERYSRPLRHCIVSAHQHMIIFQNVEKLVTISEYHIKQMQDNTSSVDSDTEDSQSGESSMFPNSVALIYQSKVHMLCQAYESYANGLANSNTLLKELRKNRDFMSFVKEPASEDGQSLNQPTISAFINRPVQHIQELCVVLSEIFAATPLHSPDFATLQQIVIKLSQCITNITCLSSAGRVQSLDSLASSQGRTSSQAASSSKGSMASLSSSSSADPDSRPLLPNATASVRSLDRDVLRIQEKLALAPNIPAFQLCQESRHLIYQGNIYRCNKGSWFKSQLILFSDLILVVDEEADGTLLVATNPVYVQEISGIEINRKYASEFVLHLYPATSSTLPRKQSLTASSAADNARAIMLRAPSAQEKYVWQSLLEQRVAAVNGNKLKHYGSMRDISNFKTSIIL